MAHKSRLRLAKIAEHQRKYECCQVCGCTDLEACMTEEGPCHWVAPGLCSNPECVAKVTAQVASGKDVYLLG